MTFVFDPDDPRQVKALEAATDATYKGSGLWPSLDGARALMRGHVLDGLAAYFSALQTEGVRLVALSDDRCVCGGEDSDGRGDVLRCPVHGIGEEAVAAPPPEPEAICSHCRAPKGLHAVDQSCNQNCGGRVVVNPRATAVVAAPPCKACEGLGTCPGGGTQSMIAVKRPCPRCNGSGLARMVALDDVVEFVRTASWRDDGTPRTDGDEYSEAIERRFSGTGEECCNHEWVDVRNEHVQSGELCLKCGAIQASGTGEEQHG